MSLAQIDKKDLIKALNISVKELQTGIDMHCCLVTSILQGDIDERNLLPLLEMCPRRSREAKLKKAIKESIEVLEESRKAFKSKKLELLRKKLTDVLIDSE